MRGRPAGILGHVLPDQPASSNGNASLLSNEPLPPILLASASPRRAQLLASIGLKFDVAAPDIDETPAAGEGPAALVGRLALAKVAALAVAYPDSLVIAADTTVALGGEILNKPADEGENRAFIERLAGREHEVFTGHALAFRGRTETAVVRTVVELRPLSDEEIARYCASREGLDKAGGYGIQGLGGALVSGVRGCYANVMGLSVVNVVMAARRLGISLV